MSDQKDYYGQHMEQDFLDVLDIVCEEMGNNDNQNAASTINDKQNDEQIPQNTQAISLDMGIEEGKTVDEWEEFHRYNSPQPTQRKPSAINDTPIPDIEQQKTQDNMDFPTENDVICGRGNRVNNYSGNIYLRAVVKALRSSYVEMPKPKKPMIAKAVINHLLSFNPPARFLKYDLEQKQWCILDEKKALEKVRQALRENVSSIKNQVSVTRVPTGSTRSLEDTIMDQVNSILSAIEVDREVGSIDRSHHRDHERMPIGPSGIITTPLKRSDESKQKF